MKTFKSQFTVEVELPLAISDHDLGEAIKEFSNRIDKFCIDFEAWLCTTQNDEICNLIRVRPKL